MPGLRRDLPPGPGEPSAVQTVEWVIRPTDLLRRAQARYGEPFTLRTAWSDAPMVVVSDPEEIRRIYTAPDHVLQGGSSAPFMRALAGPRSVLVLHGAEHLRQRRLMLPAFHGEALAAWREAIARLAHAELDSWTPGVALQARPRMARLTLEVMLRVVFGTDDPLLRDRLRRTLDLTGSAPRLVAMSLLQRDLRGLSPYGRFLRALGAVDVLLHERVAAGGAPGSVLATLLAARHEDGTPPSREELRDQLLTLLAAGHETTATALAWAVERLARHPDELARLREGGDAELDAAVKEVLRVRPVLSITPRRVLAPWRVGAYTLPPGVHVVACPYLTHRRAELWPDPTAFRPVRFLDGAPEPYTWLPFGGGTRRCLGAAFAALEMREVLRALAARFALRPDRADGERMRRRSVTLSPSRGGRVIPESLA
jgi:cytochrome P450 family 135